MYSSKNTIFSLMASLIFILITGSSVVNAQNTQRSAFCSEVSKIILESDCQVFSSFFNSRIDMTILDKSAMYSQQQAKIVLCNFFKNNNPVSFNITNENDESAYLIGKLHTDDNNFRVFLLVKKEETKYIIYQLRIEK